jgi:tRNA(fMet)-specific endonuclease VapC
MLEFDKEDARQACAARALLASRGRSIGPYDVLIAGQALARNMTLITRNMNEFSRVPGLRAEDWSA